VDRPAAGELRALGAVLAVTAGQAALRRALALYAALFIAAVLIFAGKYAMRASEPVAVARHALGFRAGLLLAWLMLALPVARAWLVSPAARFVRVFPVRWTAAALVLAAGLLVVEAPWIILFTRGGGALAGGWAAVAAAAGHALLLGRPRRWYEGLAAVLWLAAVALGPGPALALALGLPALAAGCRRAWVDGWEARARPARAWVPPHSPALALACAHLVSLLRRQRALLGRWTWMACAGLAIAALAIHNNGITVPDRISLVSLVVLAPVTTANVLAAGAALLRFERRAHWLLDVTGTPAAARRLAAALALAAAALPFALAHGVLIAVLTGGSARVWGAAGAAGAGLGAVGALAVRWADRGGGQDAGRFVAAGLTICALVIGLASWRGELGFGIALLALATLAALLPVPRQRASARARAADDQD
jgi:hypothetical protein